MHEVPSFSYMSPEQNKQIKEEAEIQAMIRYLDRASDAEVHAFDKYLKRWEAREEKVSRNPGSTK